MDKVIKIVSNNRQKIDAILSKKIEKSFLVTDVIIKVENWNDNFKIHSLGCINSVETDLASPFNRAYQDESEMILEINNGFSKHNVHSDNLKELLYDIKRHYSHDYEEQNVIDAMTTAIEIILKDLQILYIQIEDAIHNKQESANLKFSPDISTPFIVINNYIANRIQIEEQNNLNSQETKKQSFLFSLLAGVGLGLLMGGGNDDEC